MSDERAGVIVRDILDAVREVIRRHEVTYPEYRQAIRFMAEAGRQGGLPLLCGVLLETVVDEVAVAAPGATDSNVEGPFFVAGAPPVATDNDGLAVLPRRAD